MSNPIRKFSFFCLITYLFCFFSYSANAENLGFSVQVEQPNSQNDKSKSYLDLRMSPLEETELVVILKNSSKKEALGIEVNYSSAKTNSEGIVEYAPYEEMPTDQSLKHDFKDVVRGPKELLLKPNETKTLRFQIQMPKEKFDGYIAGGIELKQKPKDETKEILNAEFSYVIGARISQNDNKVEPQMEYRKIQSGFRFGKPNVMVYLANTSSNYMENVEIKVDIREVNGSKVLLTKTKEGLRIAPNSMILFPVQVDDQKLKTAKYEADISVKTKEGYKKEWSKPFTYKLDETGKYESEKEVYPIKERKNLNVTILIITIMVVLISCGLFLLKLIKKEE